MGTVPTVRIEVRREFSTVEELADTLRAIAARLDEGCRVGNYPDWQLWGTHPVPGVWMCRAI